MKNFKTIIAVLAISLSTVFTATATDPVLKKNKENSSLRTEMSSYLGNDIPVILKQTTAAEVSFLINNKNEIVVLSVDSKVSELNTYLKSKFNYKKINLKGIKKGEIYLMPLKFEIK
ncbi:hypothetical protein [uncultured Polaribacter sp.]|uniref:hypothetical protein n=1 Tax=uncultured Polaribacter sp. TaxID=174711 RepID=UPI00261AFF7F|nr:hypothetical protein [uncultured Polaribacter sp.]